MSKQEIMKDRPEKEISVEDYLFRACVERKWLCWKLNSPGRRGVPDRLVIAPTGVAVFVETKKPRGGKISSLQARTLKMLTERGHYAYIIFNKSEVDALMNMIEELVRKRDAMGS